MTEATVSAEDPTAAPGASAEAVPPTPKVTAPMGLAHVMLIAVACSALSGVVAWKFAVTHASVQPRLVAVDFARLANAQIEKASNKPREEALKMATEFSTALNAVTKEYADRGYWVIDSDRVLAIPFGNDITDEVTARLSKSNAAGK
ncbi:MAG: hypothetical protein NT159_07280 [Proteobacteria bacterium]|nr:hypothetical protein [Pseudomonadota bacterium]